MSQKRDEEGARQLSFQFKPDTVRTALESPIAPLAAQAGETGEGGAEGTQRSTPVTFGLPVGTGTYRPAGEEMMVPDNPQEHREGSSGSRAARLSDQPRPAASPNENAPTHTSDATEP